MPTEFHNRLLKNHKHTSKWARRQGITCYRVYDLDIPAFPLCVDVYDKYVHVAEYKAKHGMSEVEHAEWLSECMLTISQVLGTDLDNIFLKRRERQKGSKQYGRFSDESFGCWVEESGLKFWINLTDYLDTGLFLDHRITRQMVREMSAGKKVLNLFAYTGSFSVYAAAGGAEEVVTVDMSQTYLSWAMKNMAENGFADPKRFRYERQDILQWVNGLGREQFDIIVLDPPTFSNSKKMLDVLDIQRDHFWLINKSLKALQPGGTMFFSNNLRSFRLESERIRAACIKDITAQTIPPDFRNKQIHHCYLIAK